jgi:hypothetical protein
MQAISSENKNTNDAHSAGPTSSTTNYILPVWSYTYIFKDIISEWFEKSNIGRASIASMQG